MSELKTTSDISLTGLLTIAFVVLKLCKVIAWSWWWVLSPLWIHLAIALIFVIGMALFHHSQDKREQKRTEDPGNNLGNWEDRNSRWNKKIEEMRKAQEKAKQN